MKGRGRRRFLNRHGNVISTHGDGKKVQTNKQKPKHLLPTSVQANKDDEKVKVNKRQKPKPLYPIGAGPEAK